MAPRKISKRVERILYVRDDDGNPYVHEFGRGAELWTEDDGTVSIRNVGRARQWTQDRSGRRWLVNPPRKGNRAVAAGTPVEVRPKTYRGRSGFIVTAKEGRGPFNQRVFVTTRAAAEAVKQAMKHGREITTAMMDPRPQAAVRENPSKRRKAMARRMPKRNAKGRFVKGGSSGGRRRKRAARRSNPVANPPRRRKRRRAVARRAAPRRRRRNPPGLGNIGDRIIQAGTDALTITTGQAAVRIIPTLLPLPQSGPVGLAISTATAILTGMAAERVVSRDTARMFVAGAMSVPLQKALATYVAPSVPLVGRAMGLGRFPARSMAGVAGYSRPRVSSGAAQRAGVAGYDFANAAAMS